MDYEDAALFARVVEMGSFTAAAKVLGLPKSSVSRRVARLERDLGARLLQRTTRHLALTVAGQSFYERAQTGIAALDEAATTVRESGAAPRGKIRLTAPADAFDMSLPAMVADFARRYPAIELELVLTSRVVDLVGEGVDLAVRAGMLADSTLVARRIGVIDSVLCAAPSYLADRGRPKTVSDLAAHECVLFRAPGGRMRWRLTGPSGEETVDVHGRVSVDEIMFLTHLTASGAGIGLVPVSAAHALFETGALETLMPQYRSTGAALSIVLPSARFVPARVALLRDFLVERLTAELTSMAKTCSRKTPRASATKRTPRRV